jgi:pyruvate dehydrogenase E1 component
MKAVPDQIARWFSDFTALGTDGLGRSDSRKDLRRFFEVDAECVAAAALSRLARRGEIPPEKAAEALNRFGLKPDKPDPFRL